MSTNLPIVGFLDLGPLLNYGDQQWSIAIRKEGITEHGISFVTELLLHLVLWHCREPEVAMDFVRLVLSRHEHGPYVVEEIEETLDGREPAGLLMMPMNYFCMEPDKNHYALFMSLLIDEAQELVERQSKPTY